MIPARDSQRITVIEYLRGVASVSVAWFHMTNTYGAGSIVAKLGSLGWVGVDSFFVISGFIIPLSLWRRTQRYDLTAFRTFIGKRLLRIEIPYLVSIAATVLAWHLSTTISPYYQGDGNPYSLAQIAANIFYVVPFSKYAWMQPVYWTLGFEFLFYLVISVCYGILLGRHGFGLWLAISAGVMVSVMVGGLPTPMLLFVIGFSLFRVISGNRDFLLCAVITLICGIIISSLGNFYSAFAGVATAGLIYLGLKLNSPAGVLHKIFLYLGTISYSLYLTHVLVGGKLVNLGRRYIDGSAQEFLLSIASLAVSIGAAALFYSFVERPAVRLSRRFGASRGRFSGTAAGLREAEN